MSVPLISPRRTSPLDTRELLDLCLNLMVEDMAPLFRQHALMACVLVARSWVEPSQSLFYREPERINPCIWECLFDNRRPLLRLYRTLNTCPHLIRHVRVLEMSLTLGSAAKESTFRSFCKLPFPQLERVSILFRRQDDCSMAFQELFSLPTLAYIQLNTVIYDMDTFTEIWRRCSPSIRHLDLEAILDLTYEPSTDGPDCVPAIPIQLESLRAVFTRTKDSDRDPAVEDIAVYPWALYPFDLANLKALSIRDDKGVAWEKLHLKDTIQVLDVNATEEERAVDLALFPNLSLLRITPVNTLPPMILATLSTITPFHRIKTVAVDLAYDMNYSDYDVDLGDEMSCAPLDSKLCGLSVDLPPTVELEASLESPNREIARTLFPGLISREMLRFVNRRANYYWWKDLVYAL
ncbi:hypothetical protein C8R45DRAFT_999315 [Mycena sanguinolenta]|nr:hypothetical protein C8R45DRAFT_999315 [Mycena sanguinolenta]